MNNKITVFLPFQVSRDASVTPEAMNVALTKYCQEHEGATFEMVADGAKLYVPLEYVEGEWDASIEVSTGLQMGVTKRGKNKYNHNRS